MQQDLKKLQRLCWHRESAKPTYNEITKFYPVDLLRTESAGFFFFIKNAIKSSCKKEMQLKTVAK